MGMLRKESNHNESHVKILGIVVSEIQVSRCSNLLFVSFFKTTFQVMQIKSSRTCMVPTTFEHMASWGNYVKCTRNSVQHFIKGSGGMQWWAKCLSRFNLSLVCHLVLRFTEAFLKSPGLTNGSNAGKSIQFVDKIS